jgi:hypothetical protein
VFADGTTPLFPKNTTPLVLMAMSVYVWPSRGKAKGRRIGAERLFPPNGPCASPGNRPSGALTTVVQAEYPLARGEPRPGQQVAAARGRHALKELEVETYVRSGGPTVTPARARQRGNSGNNAASHLITSRRTWSTHGLPRQRLDDIARPRLCGAKKERAKKEKARPLKPMRPRRGQWLLLLLLLIGAASAYFPDLSNTSASSSVLVLSSQQIDEIPAGAFARFTALQTL